MRTAIREVSDPERRVFDLGGIGAATIGALLPWLAGRAVAAGSGPLIGFKSVPVSEQDLVPVPEGYEAVALAAWGEPIDVPDNMPAFRRDASKRLEQQLVIETCKSARTFAALSNEPVPWFTAVSGLRGLMQVSIPGRLETCHVLRLA